MTNDRMTRWLGPLGLGFLVAIVLGFFIVGPTDSPGDHASGADVVAFYNNHSGRAWASIYIVGVGLALLTFFISGLRHALREANPNRSWLSNAAFAGGLVFIGGFGLLGMNHLTTIEAARGNRPDVAAQANFIDNQYPVPVILGLFVVTAAVGVAILAGSTLPHWLGWLSIAMAVVTLAGPIAFAALLAFPIWVTILGFVIGARSAEQEASQATTARGRMGHRMTLRHHH